MRPSNFILLTYISLLILTAGLKVSNGEDQEHGLGRGRGGRGEGPGNGEQNKQPGHKITSDCPQLETISRDITWRRVAANPALPAKLIRMQFHDCFVRGCDASILLDSSNNSLAEKEATPNRSLAGFEVIDEIKKTLEEECPGRVSCADILALAARDAVSFQFQRPLWPVSIGRRDGRVSLALEADRDLPSPFADFTALQRQFESRGLNIEDLVALSGAHTIGVGHCAIIENRLFNFTGKGDTDPSLDQNYANFLKHKCSRTPSPTATVEMDPGSSLSFDSHYFVALNQNRSLFQSDAALLTVPEAARLSRIFQNQPVFFDRFAQSVVKMASIGVLKGNQGEIRKNCRVVN